MSLTDFDPAAPATSDGIFGLPHTPEEARVVLLPVPWEPTTSYRKGTAGGPQAILEASGQVDLYDRETGRPYEQGIAMLEPDADIVAWNAQACELAQPIIDAGGAGDDASLAARLAQVNALSAELDAKVEALAASWIDRGKLVGLVGGDHSTPFGLIRALASRHPGLGVLHVDAHADLREAYEGFTSSHASIMFNVHARIPEVARIVQVGIRDFSEAEAQLSAGSPRLRTYYDADLARHLAEGHPFVALCRAIVADLPRKVYVSLDIDGLDPSLCPNTGTPVPGGLSFRDLCTLLRVLVESGREIVGFDLNEVAGEGEWDAIVGARVLYKLAGYALRSHAAR
jgi:agmatinase